MVRKAQQLRERLRKIGERQITSQGELEKQKEQESRRRLDRLEQQMTH